MYLYKNCPAKYCKIFVLDWKNYAHYLIYGIFKSVTKNLTMSWLWIFLPPVKFGELPYMGRQLQLSVSALEQSS